MTLDIIVIMLITAIYIRFLANGLINNYLRAKESEARLHELNATKAKFFTIIAHDLKNPLNSILGFSEFMVSQIQEGNYEKIEEYAEIIRNSSQRAMDLLQNLLEWSHSQTGRMEYRPQSVEIGLQIDEIIGLLGDTAVQKDITLSVDLPEKIIVFADKAMICTILRNLISNAIKFTYSGGTIRISAEQNPNECVISVSDNGIGMKLEDTEKLFRIDKNTSTLGTQNETGTGLGLVLCKEFIEEHRGRIWVESEPGKGSKFSFSLPSGKSL